MQGLNSNSQFGILLIFIILGVNGCGNTDNNFDASGVFESTEIIISSEANGLIKSFEAEEGSILREGEVVVGIEVTDLQIQKEQVEATIEAIQDKQNDAAPQISILKQQMESAEASLSILETQLEVLLTEQQRIHNLYTGKAATLKQKEDVDGRVSILEKQIESAESGIEVVSSQVTSARQSVAIQNRGIVSEKKPLEKQKAQIENRLNKGSVINPGKGTLISKYAYAGEFVNIGKPLYRLADLSVMNLRAYVDGSQLSELKLMQAVTVYVDKGAKEYRAYEGQIIWISDKAEFTPKSIQTKNERANLVYAIKVKVINDGYIRIGSYGELKFDAVNESEE